MSSVKRYWHKPGKGFAVLDPIYYQDESGFVTWEDYDALSAECQRLREALEQAKEWLEGWASAEPYLSVINAALAGSKEGDL